MRRARAERSDEQVHLNIESIEPSELGDNEVRLDVRYSSVNYKDALAANGHPGVVRQLPLTPGIDAVGEVRQSNSPQFRPGQMVIATGHGFGVERDGGWTEQLDAPADWLVPLPEGLSPRDAMVLGTAGFTAMQCTDELRSRKVPTDAGEVLVTGATGGVGSIAVALLARAGYQVVASTGKTDRHDWLRRLGAKRCIGREEAAPDSSKPMLKSQWAGAVDTVGGATLSAVVRSLKNGGAVAACGVVAGHELDLTVYPFILRGVSLIGVDSAWHPMADRRRIWETLAETFQAGDLDPIIDSEVTLDALPQVVETILAGGVCGRTLVRPSNSD